ncbi:MAG: hypothetical protein HOP30_21260 [Cyclobacteriaceae bacterium]|nr:hypothetical protein [Cyclobacteriaceae bacterium]
MKEDFAIIIGINDYTPPNQLGLKTLQGAVNDANQVEAWVSSPTGGNVPAANIKKIISTPAPLKPVQDEIDEAFLGIRALILSKGGFARRLYFYFAGHGLGIINSTVDTALCLAKWSEERRQSALSSELYKDYIKQYGYFEEIIFIADCCRNTKISITPQPPTFRSPIPGQGAGQTKMFVAYATQYQDQSFEVESIHSEMRGAFTSVLLDGLKGAAANNGSIGADDLRDYLYKKTPEIAIIQGYKQIPDISHSFANNFSLVTVPISNTNVTFTFSATRNNLIELSDGNLNVLETFDGSKNKSFSKQLSKGLYMLSDTITGDTISFPVSPTQNNTHVNF